MSKVNYICEECKSDDISFDAYAEWDADNQDFAMTRAFEVGAGDIVCNECGHESTHADEVPYISEAKTIEVPICEECKSENIEVWQPTRFEQNTGKWVILDSGLPEVYCQSKECDGGDVSNDYDTKTVVQGGN